MASVIGLNQKFFEYAGRQLDMRDVERDSSVVTGLLNGVLADEMAVSFNVSSNAMRMHSSRVRDVLGLDPNNQRGLLPVSFGRGLSVVVTDDDLINFRNLDESQKCALGMIADGKSNGLLREKFGLSVNRVSKLVTSCSEVLIPSGTKRQSLLPAMTFRAVQIFQARERGDDNFLSRVNVELGVMPVGESPLLANANG